MRENLRKAFLNPLVLIGGLLFFICLSVSDQPGFYFYLTSAQLIFVPVVVQLIVRFNGYEKGLMVIGMIGAALASFDVPYAAATAGAALYFLGTCVIAWKGVERFLNRGFVNTAELLIDAGFIYIAVGGGWFFAYTAEIDTGFTTITTWLTAIHFHYSAFLLCVSVGLLGRMKMTAMYRVWALIIATGPITVAIGITLSRMIEMISVSLYVVAVYAVSVYLFRLKFPPLQSVLIRIPFLTLCVTILWSFLYAYGSFSGNPTVNIPTMLHVHGMANCILFGSFTAIGWSLHVPLMGRAPSVFPVSNIRGKLKKIGRAHEGLVDRLDEYVDTRELPAAIPAFYEQTGQFRLFASVKWSAWFKPFAFIFRLISQRMGQLNLPLSSKEVEMTGEIHCVDEQLDGRLKPRVWKRMIGTKTVFVAIYSKHSTNGYTYMNIALPLPWSSMHGILLLTADEGMLRLTSEGHGDAGTYLSMGRYTFKLPLHEHFLMKEENGKLTAEHHMTLFGLHFLKVDYLILKKAAANDDEYKGAAKSGR